ncbi:MAG TPA: cupin domain-containing protein [Stellaceae bacterium]|nr:cupin domain-containing protein [Stellaceae bacterium]
MRSSVMVAALGFGALPLAAAAQSVAPQTVLDNPSVRVEMSLLPPGAGTGQHQGIEAEIGIVADGTLTLDSALSHEVLQPGKAYWLPGLIPHDVRNEGDRPARMFAVLLKRCD